MRTWGPGLNSFARILPFHPQFLHSFYFKKASKRIHPCVRSLRQAMTCLEAADLIFNEPCPVAENSDVSLSVVFARLNVSNFSIESTPSMISFFTPSTDESLTSMEPVSPSLRSLDTEMESIVSWGSNVDPDSASTVLIAQELLRGPGGLFCRMIVEKDVTESNGWLVASKQDCNIEVGLQIGVVFTFPSWISRVFIFIVDYNSLPITVRQSLASVIDTLNDRHRWQSKEFAKYPTECPRFEMWFNKQRVVFFDNLHQRARLISTSGKPLNPVQIYLELMEELAPWHELPGASSNLWQFYQ